MKKKILKIIPIVVLLTAILLLIPYITEYTDNKSEPGKTVVITIPEGATVPDIAALLKENGLIKHEIVFRLKLKFAGNGAMLNYGTYTLDDGMCINDIIKTLSGPAARKGVTVVIPEGFSVEQIAARLDKMGLCTAEDFFEALNADYSYSFIQHIPEGNYNYKLQGFLFPETYTIYDDATAYDIVNIMLAEFEKRYTSEVGAIDSTVFEKVNKAALIEKEAMLDRERPIIAGVIENRLKAGMPLQIDAAIVYAISKGTFDVEQVLYKDLEIDSPYNIYKNKGIPAGPICNPGITSLKAASSPESHSYLFYHTDTTKNDGSHIFTETYQDHTQTQ